MPTPSASSGRAAHDASLAGPIVQRGLTYPLGRDGPATGELVTIAPGVGWARMPLPGPLGHINVWVLDDGGDGVALVDTGVNLPKSRAAWDALIAGPLAGRRVTRVIGTHMHPDHIGLAGWLCARFDVPLWMTRTEWLMARMLTADVRDAPPDAAIAAMRLQGWPEARIAVERQHGWGRFAMAVSPLPVSYRRIVDGERIAIGEHGWTVTVGSGHTPEHACLVAPTLKLMIAGDQVLPRITSNVSISLSEPEGDPLGDWLASIARFRELPEDLLVLPAHGEPFTGLHARLDALRDGHLGQLDRLHQHLAEPRRVVDCFGVLFKRAIDDELLGMAAGEAMAHLRRLERDGRARSAVRQGVAWFEAV